MTDLGIAKDHGVCENQKDRGTCIVVEPLEASFQSKLSEEFRDLIRRGQAGELDSDQEKFSPHLPDDIVNRTRHLQQRIRAAGAKACLLHVEQALSLPVELGMHTDFLNDLSTLIAKKPGLMAHFSLIVEEAVGNSFHHGNKNDPFLKIEGSVEVEQGESPDLHVVVQDEGKGFDVKALPDPTDPANIGKPGGRGVMLIHSFSDEVTYFDAGNGHGSGVRITFSLDKLAHSLIDNEDVVVQLSKEVIRAKL